MSLRFRSFSLASAASFAASLDVDGEGIAAPAGADGEVGVDEEGMLLLDVTDGEFELGKGVCDSFKGEEG